MKQITMQPKEQEVILEKSIGNLFEEFLIKKNRLAEFGYQSKRTLIAIDGEVLRLGVGGFPAKVSQVLKLVIKPTQEIRFHPWIAAG